MKIAFKKTNELAQLPSYAHPGDAGADLYSVEDIIIPVNQHRIVNTGIALAGIDCYGCGVELQIRPRSGMASKHGVTVLNTPGTIDAGYRGDIKVILINLGNMDYKINIGDRIAQLIVAPVLKGEFVEVDDLSISDRGIGCFGSTGK